MLQPEFLRKWLTEEVLDESPRSLTHIGRISKRQIKDFNWLFKELKGIRPYNLALGLGTEKLNIGSQNPEWILRRLDKRSGRGAAA
jgi:hypothetical protein